MFDENSFLDEIKTKWDASNAVDYLAHNEHAFLEELRNGNVPYEDRENSLRQVWANLVNSCKRVGYTDRIVETKAKMYT